MLGEPRESICTQNQLQMLNQPVQLLCRSAEDPKKRDGAEILNPKPSVFAPISILSDHKFTAFKITSCL